MSLELIVGLLMIAGFIYICVKVIDFKDMVVDTFCGKPVELTKEQKASRDEALHEELKKCNESLEELYKYGRFVTSKETPQEYKERTENNAEIAHFMEMKSNIKKDLFGDK